ncbi:O-antigen ligase family protein [Natronorarus salvus]|uniref:O-antigen ligase family protein n=1 Tax=Natronorarus salvus TaxID=3117733 RepID=UPI002F2655B6
MDRTRLIWGGGSESQPTVPLHYPLLAVLAITAAVAPNTWFIPSRQGYLISLSVLLIIIVYAILLTDIRLRTDPIFLLLIGGYWLGLVAHYQFYSPHTELFEYIVVTPIAVFATVIVLPRLVRGRKQTFAMGLTLLGVLMSLFGIWMLWRVSQGDPFTIMGSSPAPIGQNVMGYERFPIHTRSVFSNSNSYGLFMMIVSLAALYTVLARGGLLWALAFLTCVLGLFMSEGDAAYLGFTVGSLIVLSGRDRWLVVGGLGVGVLTLYAVIRIGHIPDVMDSTLMSRVNRWVQYLERLAEDPLWGIGFVDPGPEIGRSSGPHNSFLHALLNTGIIAGSLYLGSLAYALAHGIRKRWSVWTAFVVGSTVALFLFMGFESLFLGGLSVSSVALGFFLGCCLLNESEEDGDRIQPVTMSDAIRNSRTARLLDSVRGPSQDSTGRPVDLREGDR